MTKTQQERIDKQLREIKQEEFIIQLIAYGLMGCVIISVIMSFWR